jgi:hypothetical protein
MRIRSAIIVLAAPLVMCATVLLLGGAVRKPQDAPVFTSATRFVASTGQKSDKTNPDAPQNQPLMATGADLEGPPQRFPAGQTPE